jgi:hypothetical protein
LEALYANYFQVQQALAADKLPPRAAAQNLHAAAKQLAQVQTLTDSAQKLAQEVAGNSEHLHHLDLAGARNAFKPISHAVVTLATQLRSADAKGAFTHFYCPMVPGGGGDWLQPGGELLNPYFGSQMLHCGEKVEELPIRGERPAGNGSSNGQNNRPQAKEGLAVIRAAIDFCVPTTADITRCSDLVGCGLLRDRRAHRCHSEPGGKPGHRFHRMAGPLTERR